MQERADNDASLGDSSQMVWFLPLVIYSSTSHDPPSDREISDHEDDMPVRKKGRTSGLTAEEMEQGGGVSLIRYVEFNVLNQLQTDVRSTKLQTRYLRWLV